MIFIKTNVSNNVPKIIIIKATIIFLSAHKFIGIICDKYNSKLIDPQKFRNLLFNFIFKSFIHFIINGIIRENIKLTLIKRNERITKKIYVPYKFR